jgi:hypothetical protein
MCRCVGNDVTYAWTEQIKQIAIIDCEAQGVEVAIPPVVKPPLILPASPGSDCSGYPLTSLPGAPLRAD